MKISVCVIVTGNVKSRKRLMFALRVHCLSCSYGHPPFFGHKRVLHLPSQLLF